MSFKIKSINRIQEYLYGSIPNTIDFIFSIAINVNVFWINPIPKLSNYVALLFLKYIATNLFPILAYLLGFITYGACFAAGKLFLE